MSSADCLLWADCLLSHLETSNADSDQSQDVWNGMKIKNFLLVQLFVYFQLIVNLSKYYFVRPVT